MSKAININTIKTGYQSMVQYMIDNKFPEDKIKKMILDLSMTKRLPSIIKIDGIEYKYDTQLKMYIDKKAFFNTSSMMKDVEKIYNKMLNNKKEYKMLSNQILDKMRVETDAKKQTELLQKFQEVSNQMIDIDNQYQKELEKYKNEVLPKLKIPTLLYDEAFQQWG